MNKNSKKCFQENKKIIFLTKFKKIVFNNNCPKISLFNKNYSKNCFANKVVPKTNF